jgi:hypothetical protein
MELGYRHDAAMPNLPLTSSLYRATPNHPQRDLSVDVNRRPPPVPQSTATVRIRIRHRHLRASGADWERWPCCFCGREGVRNFAFSRLTGGMASSLESVDYPYGRKQLRTALFASAVYDMSPVACRFGIDGTYTAACCIAVSMSSRRPAAESGIPMQSVRPEASVSLNEWRPHSASATARRGWNSAPRVSALFRTTARLAPAARTASTGQNVAKYRGISGADYARWQQLVDEGRYNPLRDTQVFGPPQEFLRPRVDSSRSASVAS